MKAYQKIFVILSILLSSVHAQKISPTKEVIYKQASDVDLKLHVFEPEGHRAEDQRTAVIYFFGGGWQNGRVTQFYEQAHEMAALGVVGISAEYRVKGKNKTTPFEAVEDAKSAVRWVREHAKELGVDPNKIIASGGSAGGHLAVCTAVIEGQECATENHEVSSEPNAVIAYNPVLDTTDKGYGAKHFSDDQKTTLSPCHQVKPNLVPVLVLHGTADKTVPFENAERFVKLMDEAGNDATLISYEGRGHGFFNSAFFRPKPNAKRTADYRHSSAESVKFLRGLGYLDEDEAAAESPLATEPIRVTCVGDSITAGSYPKILQNSLGQEWKVTNCGKGAATVIDGTLRPYHTLPEYQKALESSPDYVIIMLGVNDANPKWWSDPERKTDFKGSPINEFKANYLKLIQSFQSLPSKPEIIVATPLPVFPENAKDALKVEREGRKQTLEAEIIPLIKELAQQEEWALVDQYTLMAGAKELCRDGVHYNREGCAQFAAHFAKELQELAKEEGSVKAK